MAVPDQKFPWAPRQEWHEPARELVIQRHRRLPCAAWATCGLVLFAGGLWALVHDIEHWNVVWYVPAWYGYLLMLDAVICRIQGESFLSGRRRELAAMLLWSVPFWFLFEAYNLVIKNWYYVFALHTPWIQGSFACLAFATVLPACFVHAELFRALGWWEHLRCRPVQVRGFVSYFLLGFGILCIVLPLAWPRYAFWMVWGATLGIPEVINYRVGSPSLLRDLEAGRPGRLLRLLAGGFWAGLVWEGFNYWARCKWIYTVPGLEEWKLFEMPLMGFLGFPVLALEAFAFYALLCRWLRGGRHWEYPDNQPGEGLPPVRYGLCCGAALAFCWLTYLGVWEINVQSQRPLLTELDGLDQHSARQLRSAGIPSPERLCKAIRSEGLGAVARRTGIGTGQLQPAYRHAALALHKGMGTQTAALLLAADVLEVSDLAATDPQELFLCLRRLAEEQGKLAPRLAHVKVWVRAARLVKGFRVQGSGFRMSEAGAGTMTAVQSR